MKAGVWIGSRLVGRLIPNERTGRVAFVFDPHYLADPKRPILSRAFEDLDLNARRVFHGHDHQSLHPFFRNALPEGALRKFLEATIPHARLLEYLMLLKLGEDLPGNLRITADALDTDEAELQTENSLTSWSPSGPIRFSLAGVQLKASILEREKRLTLPLSGESGDWIAKFPSAALAELPENEYAILRWARAAGLDVPEHRLVPVSTIDNLPNDFPSSGQALIVRRFDRSRSGRIHQEDFAQIFNIDPEQKYLSEVPDHVHYGSIGAILGALCGKADFHEYMRRIAFMVLSGNGDAHVKNWALIYPDGLRSRLSPAYDMVATLAYKQLDKTLALSWCGPEDDYHTPHIAMDAIGYEHCRALARFAGYSESETEMELKAFVARARETWNAMQSPEGDTPSIPQRVQVAIDAHLRRCLLR